MSVDKYTVSRLGKLESFKTSPHKRCKKLATKTQGSPYYVEPSNNNNRNLAGTNKGRHSNGGGPVNTGFMFMFIEFNIIKSILTGLSTLLPLYSLLFTLFVVFIINLYLPYL